MIKVCYCLRRREELTREEFQRYWSRVHTRAAGPDAAAALGIRQYIQLRTMVADAHDRLRASRDCPNPEYDGIAEVWFDSVESMYAAWETPAGRLALQAFIDDEQRFIDWSRSTMVIGSERRLL